jgi:thiamine kinase-like enzyme
MDVLSVENAIASVTRLVREFGREASPTVLADRSNLVLLLDERTVARVAMATSLTRVGIESSGREVAVSRWLDEHGGAVTRPSRTLGPGPFERDGFVIGFWEREAIVAERAEPRAAGAALRRIHDLLADFPNENLALWGGFEEARRILPRVRERGLLTMDEFRRFDEAWAVAETTVATARNRSASFQAVHGDAHIGNVLATDRGPVWTDWEDVFLGPVEFDLACLRSKADLFGEEREAIDAMLSAYDGRYAPDLVRDLQLVRNVQVIPWLAVFAERHPDLVPRMRARIEQLP